MVEDERLVPVAPQVDDAGAGRLPAVAAGWRVVTTEAGEGVAHACTSKSVGAGAETIGAAMR